MSARNIEARIAGDVLAAVTEHGQLTGDDLRRLVRGQGRRVDLVVRQLVTSGRLRHAGLRVGYVLGTPMPRAAKVIR